MDDEERQPEQERREFEEQEHLEPTPEADLEGMFAEQTDQGFDGESRYSRRTWLTCCIAPSLAIGAILVLTIVASLFSPRQRVDLPTRREPPSTAPETQQRRDEFVKFGKEYFAIAARADKYNEEGFAQLDKFMRGHSTIGNVHDAFAKAAKANSKAAKEFKALNIPDNLISKDKLRQSLDIMSDAYEARRRACEILVGWNGDMRDQTTAQRYSVQAEEINRLTLEGLQLLGAAADDNGLTRDDVEKFLPKAANLLDTTLLRTSAGEKVS